MSFKNLAHQSGVAAVLRSALEKGKLPHAMLFGGPSDSGQREMAVELAKAVFCEDKSGSDPCDACIACRQAGNLGHPDLYLLSLEDDARVIKVEQIRELTGRAALRPLSAAAKFFVIENADVMNETAQNALLKTLEEPQGASYFVLIASNPAALLPTIRSRVQTFNFLPADSARESDPEIERLKAQVLAHILYGHGARPELSKLERAQIVEIFDHQIAAFREMLLVRAGVAEILDEPGLLPERSRAASGYDEEELLGKLETLGEFREKFSEQINIKLALSVFWDSIRG